MMGGLKTWIAKRFSWRNQPQTITLNGVVYVPLCVAEYLMAERDTVVRKLNRERKKKRALLGEKSRTDGGEGRIRTDGTV